MGVYKEGKNWKVQVYYKDWQGNRKRKQKRGFRTKGEAKERERDFLQQQTQSVEIEFGNFLELYYKDMEVRLRENTMYTKRYIIDLKIKPYFEHKVLSEITVADIRESCIVYSFCKFVGLPAVPFGIYDQGETFFKTKLSVGILIRVYSDDLVHAARRL